MSTVTRIGAWRTAGEVSEDLARTLSSSSYTSRDLVVIGGDLPVEGTWFWNWALPFAAETPFTVKPRVLTAPEWYCCSDWLNHSVPVFRDLTAGRIEAIHTITFNSDTRKFETHSVKNPFQAQDVIPDSDAEGREWIRRLQNGKN